MCVTRTGDERSDSSGLPRVPAYPSSTDLQGASLRQARPAKKNRVRKCALRVGMIEILVRL